MAKYLTVFVISLTVLVFIIGCPSVESEPLESPSSEPIKAEPSKAESPKVEPPKAEFQETTPTQPEPPKTELPKTEPPKLKPAAKVSFHDNCADILSNFVDDNGMVDYKALKRKRSELKHLLDKFDNLDSDEYNSWSREDKIAFWINAYNIQMLNIIIDNYPIESSRVMRLFWPPNSIRHIPGILDKRKFIVMDEEFTLAEIEQRFFRKEFNEPRVFFAISQASLSSPPLRSEPYYGHSLYRQLDDQVKKFLSNPHAFRIDRSARIVYLSAIFHSTWHANDFISKYGTDKKFKERRPDLRAVLSFLTNYISSQDISYLETENYSVKYIRYDWTLNE